MYRTEIAVLPEYDREKMQAFDKNSVLWYFVK